MAERGVSQLSRSTSMDAVKILDQHVA